MTSLSLCLTLAVLSPSLALAKDPATFFHADPATSGIRLTTAEQRIANRVGGLLATPDGHGPAIDLWLVDAARRIALGQGASTRDALTLAGASDAYAVPVHYAVVDVADPVGPVTGLLETDVGRTGITHFGVGVVETKGGTRVGLVFVKRRATLSRFPKRLRVGEHFLLNGSLAADLHEPVVLLASPTSRVRETRPRTEGQVFWTQVPFNDGPGRYTIEVQARDRYGVQVLNLVDVDVVGAGGRDDAPVVRLRPESAPVRSVAEAEARAMELLNVTRRRAGLSALTRSAVLAAEARTHASEMARLGYFGHVSPRRGTLGDRLRKAGLGGVAARENVAIGPSAEAAHTELVRSPSHLRNMLEPSMTHVGVGIYRRAPAGDAAPVFTFTYVLAALQ